eukprot:3941986-Rhodomonas_salina.5
MPYRTPYAIAVPLIAYLTGRGPCLAGAGTTTRYLSTAHSIARYATSVPLVASHRASRRESYTTPHPGASELSSYETLVPPSPSLSTGHSVGGA